MLMERVVVEEADEAEEVEAVVLLCQMRIL